MIGWTWGSRLAQLLVREGSSAEAEFMLGVRIDQLDTDARASDEDKGQQRQVQRVTGSTRASVADAPTLGRPD